MAREGAQRTRARAPNARSSATRRFSQMRPMGVDSWRRHMLARDEAVFATRKKLAAMEAEEQAQQQAVAE